MLLVSALLVLVLSVMLFRMSLSLSVSSVLVLFVLVFMVLFVDMMVMMLDVSFLRMLVYMLLLMLLILPFFFMLHVFGVVGVVVCVDDDIVVMWIGICRVIIDISGCRWYIRVYVVSDVVSNGIPHANNVVCIRVAIATNDTNNSGNINSNTISTSTRTTNSIIDNTIN